MKSKASLMQDYYHARTYTGETKCEFLKELDYISTRIMIKSMGEPLTRDVLVRLLTDLLKDDHKIKTIKHILKQRNKL